MFCLLLLYYLYNKFVKVVQLHQWWARRSRELQILSIYTNYCQGFDHDKRNEQNPCQNCEKIVHKVVLHWPNNVIDLDKFVKGCYKSRQNFFRLPAQISTVSNLVLGKTKNKGLASVSLGKSFRFHQVRD